jgi:hypothetical protein
MGTNFKKYLDSLRLQKPKCRVPSSDTVNKGPVVQKRISIFCVPIHGREKAPANLTESFSLAWTPEDKNTWSQVLTCFTRIRSVPQLTTTTTTTIRESTRTYMQKNTSTRKGRALQLVAVRHCTNPCVQEAMSGSHYEARDCESQSSHKHNFAKKSTLWLHNMCKSLRITYETHTKCWTIR